MTVVGADQRAPATRLPASRHQIDYVIPLEQRDVSDRAQPLRTRPSNNGLLGMRTGGTLSSAPFRTDSVTSDAEVHLG